MQPRPGRTPWVPCEELQHRLGLTLLRSALTDRRTRRRSGVIRNAAATARPVDAPLPTFRNRSRREVVALSARVALYRLCMPPTREGRVWLSEGLVTVRSATLKCAATDVSLVLDDDTVVFEAPRSRVALESRWYWFDTVFDLISGGIRHRILLVHPLRIEGGGLGSARASGIRWKEALAQPAGSATDR